MKPIHLGKTIAVSMRHHSLIRPVRVWAEFRKMEDGQIMVSAHAESDGNFTLLPVPPVKVTQTWYENREVDPYDQTIEARYALRQLGFF